MPTPGESYSELPFPSRGVDVSREFTQQSDGTTRSAENVRGFDPIAERLRGGPRPGLARYAGQIPAGSTLIQHLELIVDPRYTALDISLDEPGSDWPLDPNTGQYYPPGGSGNPMNPNATQPNPPTPGPALRQVKTQGYEYDLTGAQQTLTFDSSVLSQSLILVWVTTISEVNTVGVAVTNGAGTAFTQAGVYRRYTDSSVSGEQTLSLWYKSVTSPANDAIVKVDPASEAAMVLAIHEFTGYATTSQLDTVVGASDSNLIAASPMAAGTVTINGNNELVVAGYMASYSPDTVTHSAGFTQSVNHSDGTIDATDIQLYVFYKLDNDLASNPAPTATLDGGADQWAAIAASFKD